MSILKNALSSWANFGAIFRTVPRSVVTKSFMVRSVFQQFHFPAPNYNSKLFSQNITQYQQRKDEQGRNDSKANQFSYPNYVAAGKNIFS